MLNITQNTISGRIDRERFNALRMMSSRRGKAVLPRLFGGLFLVGFIFMFIPWTQNIRGHGAVTTLKPSQRPQSIHTVIPGRIEKWFVQEGDLVRAGDTILYISEVKDDYFDPNLIGRADEQLKAKELTVSSYMEKVTALDAQIDALVDNRKLKMQQAGNKLQQARLSATSDSMNHQAAITAYNIAREQADRMEELYKKGLKSLTDLEQRRLRLQEADAKRIAAENDWLASQNEVINATVEINAIESDYRDKIAKAESEKFSAMSSMYSTEAEVTKLQNQRMNYSVRSGFYFITAPQDGYITRTMRAGIGETIKEGEEVVTIMPADYQLAVEVYVRPVDLPLVQKGQHVRIQFDGWPAIVFSGWPEKSYGTYGGTVWAVDNFSNADGMFRVLIQPDAADHPWPKGVRVGGGAYGMMLLQDVPIWYEIWRQINGFPPDYYSPDKTQPEKK